MERLVFTLALLNICLFGCQKESNESLAARYADMDSVYLRKGNDSFFFKGKLFKTAGESLEVLEMDNYCYFKYTAAV